MSITKFPLIVQTSYAELVDQLRVTAISDFPKGTTFRKRTIAGRSYWYAQPPSGIDGRPLEQYLGPDTPELAKSIDEAKRNKILHDGQKIIIRGLIASGLPAPDPLTGHLLNALAHEGLFRLRGVIIGTVAFQAYSGLLGVRLSGQAMRTADMDIAQDYGISLAIDDRVKRPLLEILQDVEPEFRPVSSISKPTAASSFVNLEGYRVDVLTTNRGSDRLVPVKLPSLQTEALPLRHLDFLLRDYVEAAVLTRCGVLVNVPDPARFAIHKLMVATMRRESGDNLAKINKDIFQAGQLVEVFFFLRRQEELTRVYEEACQRGSSWQQKLQQGIAMLSNDQRELMSNLK